MTKSLWLRKSVSSIFLGLSRSQKRWWSFLLKETPYCCWRCLKVAGLTICGQVWSFFLFPATFSHGMVVFHFLFLNAKPLVWPFILSVVQLLWPSAKHYNWKCYYFYLFFSFGVVKQCILIRKYRIIDIFLNYAQGRCYNVFSLSLVVDKINEIDFVEEI